MRRKYGDNNGSALIMVLWVLALVGFLAGEYLDKNRTKAGLAENSWNTMRQRQAVRSVLSLVKADSWSVPDGIRKKNGWACFSPDGIELWVKVDSESDKTNINTAPDTVILSRIQEMLGDDQVDAAGQLTDAILDWRDEDILVRGKGAEQDAYEEAGLSYGPANGPFKVMTEMLLLKGMTRDLFWGNPMRELFPDGAADATAGSVLETFTVYDQTVQRVTMLVQGKKKSYTLVVAFLSNQNGRWDVLQIYQNILVYRKTTAESSDTAEAVIEF